ncbi:ABC transporter ATP-binding protein [Agromyces aerolatus]|uniref:ABC transporter ATP-binding protein n=1 Tax=Agromyces sp. LY-1074 TaxID=3074080 RepID=UPI00285CC085|nr:MULTISPECIES: ABC transporter ATP-binding protein [unclassified Agromyces]MDR5699033.1 ABC transporter ATP-binding protein [Agromyces sp. LY-1074]MDR5705189.1 ABC transporter ATP-binding protein [Agromyces sp. LY-1358]
MSGVDRAMLEITDLRVTYPTAEGRAEVVHGIDLRVERGARVALVGESGSGKSVTARSILQLDQDAGYSGSIALDGEELIGAGHRTLRSVRGSKVGLVFQDPLTSLNPVMRIGWQIMQPLVIRGVPKREARERGIELLERLGVRDAARRFDDYPHEFSGGMRQRVVIAIAVIAEPELLIADEPTTALDVRVQTQVLELLRSLADERGMSILLITHDLGIVAGFAEEVVVMRHGSVVERNRVDELFARPSHPYTRGLLGAVPRIDGDPDRRLLSVDDFNEEVA